MILADARKLAACISEIGDSGFYTIELVNRIARAFPELRWGYAPDTLSIVADDHASPLSRPGDRRRAA